MPFWSRFGITNNVILIFLHLFVRVDKKPRRSKKILLKTKTNPSLGLKNGVEQSNI